jgi:AcrR family transcriptional regulator
MPNKSNTKVKIIDATWKLFSDLSPNTPTLAEVAKTAGVSRQTVYLHFDNRAKLLVETVQHQVLHTGSAERLKKAREVEPGMLFTSWVAAIFDQYARVLPVARTLYAATYMDQDGALAWNDVIASIRRSVNFVAESFDSLGMLNSEWSVETAVDWIYSRISFTTWHLLVYELGWSQEQVLVRTVESLESDLVTIPKSV